MFWLITIASVFVLYRIVLSFYQKSKIEELETELQESVKQINNYKDNINELAKDEIEKYKLMCKELPAQFQSEFKKYKKDFAKTYENKYALLEQEKQNIMTDRKDIQNEEAKLINEANELEKIILMKAELFPYFAVIMADFLTLHYGRSSIYLKTKKNPALQEAERITELRRETKKYLAKMKEYQYEIENYKKLFPDIDEYAEETNDKVIENIIIDENKDPAQSFLSKEEFLKLSDSERNQLALDRYVSGRKSKWQIGRDYELSVGYEYSQNGYIVEYFGEHNGLNDLGRDLIVEKDNIVTIIQCKNWSKGKLIHEKHINQLYGTVIAYCVEHYVGIDNVKGCFVTSTTLSATAKKFANLLKIEFFENKELNDFPRIKCNINNGKKIYHLPFDQQYDKTIIKNKDEAFVFAVNEAEKLGFRRAWKWHE